MESSESVSSSVDGIGGGGGGGPSRDRVSTAEEVAVSRFSVGAWCGVPVMVPGVEAVRRWGRGRDLRGRGSHWWAGPGVRGAGGVTGGEGAGLGAAS